MRLRKKVKPGLEHGVHATELDGPAILSLLGSVTTSTPLFIISGAKPMRHLEQNEKKVSHVATC